MRLRKRQAAIVLLMALSATIHAQATAQGRGGQRLPVDRAGIAQTSFTLPNGLRVVLHEDHSSPLVATELWYHVGSKNDTPGKTGIAHLFEHMMFQGSAHLPAGEYKRILQQSGGISGAQTDVDNTRFFTRVPSNQLETVLWLEAERMAFLEPALDSTRFRLERESVVNEYRQNMLSTPASGATSLGSEVLLTAAYSGTPYGLPAFGRMSELSGLTLGDLRSFFGKYYVPNNAVLVIAGDASPAETRKQVERYFGGIPRGPKVIQPNGPFPPLGDELRIVLEDRNAPTQQVRIGWRGAPSAHADRAALVALAGILDSRVQRSLVSGRGIASAASGLPTAVHSDFESGGLFQVILGARTSMTEIERLVDSVISQIKLEGVSSQELSRWKASYETSNLIGMQSVAAKALRLADATTIQGNPRAVATHTEAIRALTPTAVRRVAEKYLTPQRVVLSIVPAGKLDLVSKPDRPYTNVTPPR